MIIELVTAGLLIAGLIGGNEYLSQKTRSPESKASVANETPIQPPRPVPIESAVPLRALVSAGEATQPVQQEEQQHADTIGPVTPPVDGSGGSVWVEDDDNFDSWAK